MDNPNLAFALSDSIPDRGNLKETFFINQLSVGHRVSYPSQGDFSVDGKWTFEIGGRNKKRQQIKGIEKSFRVIDDSEYPVTDALPLWLFGFLY